MSELEINELKSLALCHGCVQETYLSSEIKRRDESRECAYCNEVAPSIALGELAKRINGVFDQHFVRTTDDAAYGSEGDGEPVVAAIADAAQIPELVAQDIQRILEDEHSDFESMTMGEETEFASDSYYEEKGTDIQAWWEEWTCFEKSLKTEARFFNGSAARTLNLVFAGIESMRTDDGLPMIVDAGPGTPHKSFYRARVFQSKEELKEALFRPDLKLGPPSFSARAGRMNAHGISVFYGSDRPEAAIAEVRPPVGSDVVVACFELLKPLRLLDLTALNKVTVRGSLFDPQFSATLERAMFLRTLSQEIVKPVMPDDEAIHYLSTQAVADFLASGSITKLDGILFPSVQAEGNPLNVVLFHNASRVESLDIPNGTRFELSSGHWDGENWEPYYTVSANLPPKQVSTVDGGQEISIEKAARLVGHLLEEMDSDNRTPALRIDTATIDVHEVKKALFKTDALKVTRYCIEDRPSIF